MGKKKTARLEAIEELVLTIRDAEKKKARRAAVAALDEHDEGEVFAVLERLGVSIVLEPKKNDVRLASAATAEPELVDPAEEEPAKDYSKRTEPKDHAKTEAAEDAREAVREQGKKKRERDAEAGVRAEEAAAPVVYALDAEAEAELDKMRKKLIRARKAWRAASEKHGAESKEAVAALGAAQEAEVAFQWKARELKLAAGFPESEIGPEPDAEEIGKRHLEHLAQVGEAVEEEAEAVSTEAEDEPELVDFAEKFGADPVTGDVFDPEQGVPVDGRKAPRIWDATAEKGKGGLRSYTRVTSFIDCLEDKRNLEDWRDRVNLAGVAADEEQGDDASTPILRRVTVAGTTLEATLASLAKRDRKGKLKPGELAELVEGAEKEYKGTMRKLAAEAFELGGGNVKSGLGTRLHHLAELLDQERWTELKEERPTPSEWRDLAAYIDACEKAGVTVIPDAIERRVVIDADKASGTYDRGVLYKREGAARALRVIGDLKTGRIDYGAGKIAMQIREYAEGEHYDPLTHERSRTGYSKTVGLLIHLPYGSGRCTIYEVDLSVGAEGLKLVRLVKAFRRKTTEAQAYRGAGAFYKELVSVENVGDYPTKTPVELRDAAEAEVEDAA